MPVPVPVVVPVAGVTVPPPVVVTAVLVVVPVFALSVLELGLVSVVEPVEGAVDGVIAVVTTACAATFGTLLGT